MRLVLDTGCSCQENLIFPRKRDEVINYHSSCGLNYYLPTNIPTPLRLCPIQYFG